MNLEKVSPNQILVNPKRTFVVWKVLQVSPETKRVRVVRASINGDLHGMVKNKDGQWLTVGELAGYVPRNIGYKSTSKNKDSKNKKTAKETTKAVPAVKAISKVDSQVRAIASQQLGTSLPDVSAEVFYRGLAKAARALAESLEADLAKLKNK